MVRCSQLGDFIAGRPAATHRAAMNETVGKSGCSVSGLLRKADKPLRVRA
jgi:hypothetical protein